MQYMILIYTDPDARSGAMTEEEGKALMREYFAYGDSLREAGVYVDAAPLEAADTATTVRVRDGQRLISDGPFAETREVLGGYYVIDCESLDTALDHAARCPGARLGSVEVRPVMAIPART